MLSQSTEHAPTINQPFVMSQWTVTDKRPLSPLPNTRKLQHGKRVKLRLCLDKDWFYCKQKIFTVSLNGATNRGLMCCFLGIYSAIFCCLHSWHHYTGVHDAKYRLKNKDWRGISRVLSRNAASQLIGPNLLMLYRPANKSQILSQKTEPFMLAPVPWWNFLRVFLYILFDAMSKH